MYRAPFSFGGNQNLRQRTCAFHAVVAVVEAPGAPYETRMSMPLIVYPPFLLSHEVLDDRGLRIVVEERSGLDPAELSPFLSGFTSQEIVAQLGDAIYEICWPVVVCFAARGDPFPNGKPSMSTLSEVGSDSAFLSWVKSESHAEPDYVAAMSGGSEPVGELRHWVVCCQEARFDVAAIAAPVVTRLGPAEVR